MRTGWRTLLVRTPVVLTLVLIVAAAVFYQWWTNPRAVRQLLLDRLSETFSGASVRVESAQLRVLGGISFAELRMARRDDLDGGDFLYVPSGIIYHDKEKLLDGCVGIRKLELYRPRLRLIRERDGTINLRDIFTPGSLDERIPTIVLQQATILLEDRGAAPGTPLVELNQLDITLVNDPLATVVVEGRGNSDVLGPLRFTVNADRTTEAVHLNTTLDSIPLGPELAQRVSLVTQATGVHLRGLRGVGSLTADVYLDPRAVQPVGFEVRGKLDRGEIHHASLPVAIERATGSFRLSNRILPESHWPRSPLGTYLPVVHLEGRAGGARVHLDATGIALPDRLTGVTIEQVVAALEVKVDNLDLTEKITAALPEAMRDIEPHYQPRGPISITHIFRREGEADWKSRWRFAFNGGTAVYHEIPCPLSDLRGTIERVSTQQNHPEVKMDLSFRVAREVMRVTGTVNGPAPSAIDLQVSGQNLHSDPELIAALPARTRAIVEQFQAAGRFALNVSIQRPLGGVAFRNHYRMRIHEGSLCYELFPYRLERVTGELEATTGAGPVVWETRQLRGFHQGAEVQIEARNLLPGQRLDVWPNSKLRVPAHPTTGKAPVRNTPAVQIRMQGSNVVLDPELEAAVAPPSIPGRRPLQRAFQTMNPSGTINFAAEIVDLPEIPNAIAVGLTLNGCRVKPKFFELPIDGVQGTVYYSQNRVDLLNLKASHAPGRFSLTEGIVFCKPSGGFQVRMSGLQVSDMPATQVFIQALPPALRKTLETIQFRGQFNVNTSLVLETGDGTSPAQVWWDGGMGLSQGSVNFGVDISGITGQFSCIGQHNGQAIEVAFGNILLDQATILKQPLRQIQAAFEIPRDQSDRFQLRNMKASLFGGTLAGEGHLRFAPNFHYDLMLKAMQVDLEQFGKHNFPRGGTELEGPATAALHLVGEGPTLADLRGNGRIDIPKGRLYRLPWMLDLLKTISLQVPDQTAFTSARSTFAIEGSRMQIQELQLTGNPLNLRGDGALNLDGTNLALDISVDWGQSLPPGLREIPRLISDQLFKIKVRGKIDAVRYDKELMPSMITPLKQTIMGN